ncbi:preprotein translocase subunit SecG [Sphingomonas paeninsulae]|jgi:preprotein translocase subunit SecG|uniref:Protein-export membrane protein SecG n=1 Tax=Sphingomonas paeninsulae TaxID=2319844 RepID=A0A494TJM4_SPHPE|nr:preprotein translocase subunit SecG [Sphingomonas paeninsulae]
MLTFLLVIHAIITATLVGVILMQQSEGGGLGMGGSPTGLMSARGAANFLSRATTILASLFVILSIVSAVVASRGASKTIDTSLARAPAPVAPAPSVPLNGDPLAAAAASGANGAAPASVPVPVTAPPVRAEVPKADEPKVQRKPVVSEPSRPTPKVDRPPVVSTTVPAPAATPAPGSNGN